MAACGSNVPMKQDQKTHLIMLKKDGRDICHAHCDSHIEVPLSWNITRFVSPTKLANLAECNHVQIYQAPNTPREEREWGFFLSFLRDKVKVAFAKSEQYCFYILPPDRHANLDSAKVAYVVEELFDSSVNAKHELSEKGNALNPNLASIHPSFLEKLGRDHDWIFGAIAEFVDNSRDAKASRLHMVIENLYYNKSGTDIPVLSIVDDGCGMTYEEIRKMVSLGHKKLDKDDFDRIGRFGTGFKVDFFPLESDLVTGAMRLGRDALVLTQTAESRSIAFLSQSTNEGKNNVEIPIISYQRRRQSMVLDTSIQSESCAKHSMKEIKKFSPFDEFYIGEKLVKFDRDDTGTQIFVWNFDTWGQSYTLEWRNGKLDSSAFNHGDIFTRHRQVRTRPGQVSQKVPLDYSLQAYLEVIFLDPRMKIYVQGSKVKSHPLAKFLSKTVVENGIIMGKHIQLILGFCQLEWEQANCGIFLYWHGRLIEAYKRVGVMFHSADMGRGVIGVIDVSTLMDGDNGHAFVHSNKQGFLDCEPYSLLVEWLSNKVNAYIDRYVDPLHVSKGKGFRKPDDDWVQCDKCRKWRIVTSGFNKKTLPPDWFCYMEPFKRTCSIPEEKAKPGVVTVFTKRYGYEDDRNSGDKTSDHHASEDNYKEKEEKVESRKSFKRFSRLRPKRCYKKRKSWR